MSTAFQGDEDVVVKSTGHLQVQLSLHVRLRVGACPEQVKLEVAD